MKFLQTFKQLTKRTKFALVAVALVAITAAPITGPLMAAEDVEIESYTGALKVGAPAGSPDHEYDDSTTLGTDEVAQVQLWYHNRQAPDSDLVAKNLRVKFNIPTTAGETQRISGTASADNSNTVTDNTVINLPSERSTLEIVPNSAKWRYNKGAKDGRAECQTGVERVPQNDPNECYVTVDLSNAQEQALTTGNGALIESELFPCNAYEATVIVQVRAKRDVISVNKMVRHFGEGGDKWVKNLNVEPGDDIEYLIQFVNQGNTVLNDVIVGDNLPKYTQFVPGYTYIETSEAKNTPDTSDDTVRIANDREIFEDGGRNAGDYAPGAYASIFFRVKVLENVYEQCGEYTVRNVALVNTSELPPVYNTADIIINNECDEEPEEPETPAYVCDALSLVKEDNRTVVANVDYTTSNGATFKDVQINFGDGSDVLTTTEDEGIRYTYDEDGNYTVTATVRFNLPNGNMVSDSGDTCVKEVNFGTATTPPTTPPRLPNTGAGSVAGLFAATTVVGTLAHKFFLGRRFNG